LPASLPPLWLLSRLHQLRAAIFNENPQANPSESAPAPPQALLLIGGVDGKFNIGSRRALAFLVEGAVGDEVGALAQSDDSLIDDVFALITPEHVFFSCNSVTFEAIKHLILSWPGLHLTVTPPPSPDDPDAGEDQKAAAFIYAGLLSHTRTHAVSTSLLLKSPAVEHVGCIAVPLTSTKAWFGEHAGQWRSDVMEVEKWPLVQVYVLLRVGFGNVRGCAFALM
jgi:hypothetical protein